ncbi:MAG: exo-alpha-sialidase [Planctomycetales bacterium]|nr:exo-alpha-sialidase [Planctomycetales bacterium]
MNPVFCRLLVGSCLLLTQPCLLSAQSVYEAELIFPLNSEHNHAPGIVETAQGDLLVSWYRGSGERRADDVRVMGAWKRKAEQGWSDAFVMADTPGFPDCNTCMFLDSENRIWLFWPLILANTWESCITQYRVSDSYIQAGTPQWQEQGQILLRPADFSPQANKLLDELLTQVPAEISTRANEAVAEARARLADPLYQRLGWQPRCKPTVLPSGRILLPLYSDTFSISIMAISDDAGKNWYASGPLLGFGNIQPSVLRKNNGHLVAYMRENGYTDHVRISESRDDGLTWSHVTSSELPNPGSGLDAVRLANGHWCLVYNDSTQNRSTLAISVSEDEGQTWKWTRHLERAEAGSYHYPSVIQGADGLIHVVYSYFVTGGKSMKHVVLNEEWIHQSDSGVK